jgi:uncharacterized protein YjbI with pentapeptide repeats
LKGAHLQGASLLDAGLQVASLDAAELQGATLDHVHLQLATLKLAQLQGAWLYGAQLQGASLDRARLQGAELNGADLHGTSFVSVCVWRADANGAYWGDTTVYYAETGSKADKVPGCDWTAARFAALKELITKEVPEGYYQARRHGSDRAMAF